MRVQNRRYPSLSSHDPFPRTVGLLWMLAPLWYLLCEAVAAAGFRGYDYATFYISDLGVPDQAEFQGRALASGLPAVMNAGFIGTGVLFLLGVVLLAPRLSGWSGAVFVVLGTVHAAGIVFVGLVPGSPSNERLGFIVIHALGAVAAILGGNLAAIVSRWALRPTGLRRSVLLRGPVFGALGILSGVLLALHAGLPDGVWERGSVYAFLTWQLLLGFSLMRRGADPRE
ncbi:DUF998 domain-containing protein [Microbacterium sp.]|uniref:DUF998 domain-containing protein n=1 Tax=Microbacterium sp. TaxID=51671 RepID=UPI00334104B1